jgi:hypothetical protein
MKLQILEKAFQSNSKLIGKLHKLSWSQRNDYFDLRNRIDYLYLIYFYLSLRPKIKKEVRENYLNKSREDILESILTYDEFEMIDFEYTFLTKQSLEPLIKNYIQQQINKIESKTLELAL